MKQLLQLSKEFIIHTDFKADLDKTKKPIWVDKAHTIAVGKNEVTGIEILVPVYDNNGYHTDMFRKIDITKADILKLIDKIKEIEAVQVQGFYSEDIPF